MRRYNAYANLIKIASILFDVTLNKLQHLNRYKQYLVLLGDSVMDVTD